MPLEEQSNAVLAAPFTSHFTRLMSGKERHTCASSAIEFCRYKEDQQKEVQEAAERAKLASMTDEERRRWELENPKVHTRQHAL